MPDQLEIVEYFIELRSSNEDDLDDLIREGMSDSAIALLKDYTPDIILFDQDVYWDGVPWTVYRVVWWLPPSIKMLIDLLGEFE